MVDQKHSSINYNIVIFYFYFRKKKYPVCPVLFTLGSNDKAISLFTLWKLGSIK